MKIRVSTIAFSNNKTLVNELKKHFEDVKVNEKGIRIHENKLYDFYKDADGIIVGLEKITSELIERLPNLKIISKYGVGLDNIDLNACKKRNIKVGWTGGVNKRSVAEMTLGFILALSRNLYLTSNQLKNNVWNKRGGIQLSGKTVGIIGVGYIGKELIELLKPFNCKILINDILDLKGLEQKNILQAEKDIIYSKSDFISIHTPLNNETYNLIDLDVLKKMKSTAFLINTSRGRIINEKDLKFALENRIIAGAALDVYEKEPPEDSEFLNFENLICTPHIGGNSKEAVLAMGVSAIKHLTDFQKTLNYNEKT